MRTISAWSSVALLTLAVVATTAEASSPRIRWQHEAQGWGEPVSDGARAYFLTRQHEVVAFEATTGRLQWRVSTGGVGEVPWGSRLAIVAGRVIVADGAVRSFDPASGRSAWRFVPPDGDAVGPFLGDAKGTVIFAGSSTGRVHAIAAETGRRVWSRRVGSAQATVFPPAASRAGIVVGYTRYGATIDGGVAFFDDRGRLQWRYVLPAGQGVGSTPVATDDLALVATTDGTVIALALASGQVAWRCPRAPGLGGRESPERDLRPLAITSAHLVVGSVTGPLIAYELQHGTEVWRYLGRAGMSVLRLRADADTVYAPYTDDSIVAIDGRTGRERWHAGGDTSPLEWPPLAAGSSVFVAGSRALIAFDRPSAASGTENDEGQED